MSLDGGLRKLGGLLEWVYGRIFRKNRVGFVETRNSGSTMVIK